MALCSLCTAPAPSTHSARSSSSRWPATASLGEYAFNVIQKASRPYHHAQSLPAPSIRSFMRSTLARLSLMVLETLLMLMRSCIRRISSPDESICFSRPRMICATPTSRSRVGSMWCSASSPMRLLRQVEMSASRPTGSRSASTTPPLGVICRILVAISAAFPPKVVTPGLKVLLNKVAAPAASRNSMECAARLAPSSVTR